MDEFDNTFCEVTARPCSHEKSSNLRLYARCLVRYPAVKHVLPWECFDVGMSELDHGSIAVWTMDTGTWAHSATSVIVILHTAWLSLTVFRTS
ncbi:hypothetical protein POX_b02604 [Penicillium oxalicum]|uniref:Uncharacterized protein n=1 Tax=Penicillium oxalicum (strain 114-2 / CGMCC 5302) TaxID=933388 RepID=S8B6U0_PENO1|nr:hypothetical protein POX_b02604 [Penicillium oxalicum]EPS30387.1 hypothetical protein PDE_05338 [Penicillium oxalicum 114-2]KAI2792566.1 hypothetical protein POX_b02604 [Penicillium oxalicum]